MCNTVPLHGVRVLSAPGAHAPGVSKDTVHHGSVLRADLSRRVGAQSSKREVGDVLQQIKEGLTEEHTEANEGLWGGAFLESE